MPILIPLVLVSWLPVCFVLFMMLSPHRAVIVAVIAGWLLLPPFSIPLPGIPDFDKMMAPVSGILLATLVFQPNRLLAFRPKWVDVPPFLWCVLSAASLLTNNLGVYNALSALLFSLVRWGFPYLIGRLYFRTREEVRDLVVGIIIGGMIWVFPCLFEIRMSQILLPSVYGSGRFEGMRLGGWRPRVFFATGLELGMWMTACSLATSWMWYTGSLRQLTRNPVLKSGLILLVLTTIGCRAFGALALLLVGLLVLWLSTRFQTRLILASLLLVPLLYYAVRIPGYWSGTSLSDFIQTYVSEERARSLAFRFEKEDLLIQRAMVQPYMGWGGWGRNRVIDERTGKDLAPTDGMWIVYLGNNGCIGLFAWTATILFPSWLFLFRIPVRRWGEPSDAPLAVIATFLGIYCVDCLANGFLNLSYLVASGGLVSALLTPLTVRPSGAGRRLPNPRRQAGPHRRAGRALAPEETMESAAGPEATPAVGMLAPSTPQERLAERYTQLARTLRSQGQAAEARAMLTHALELLTSLAESQPGSAVLNQKRWDCANDLAWLLLIEDDPTTRDPQLAVQLARQATEARPENATYWNTLGAAFERAGHPADAVSALKHSISLSDGGNGFDFVFLTLAYSRLSQPDEALRWIALADDWASSHAPAPDALVRLMRRAHEQLGPLRQPQ